MEQRPERSVAATVVIRLEEGARHVHRFHLSGAKSANQPMTLQTISLVSKVSLTFGSRCDCYLVGLQLLTGIVRIRFRNGVRWSEFLRAGPSDPQAVALDDHRRQGRYQTSRTVQSAAQTGKLSTFITFLDTNLRANFTRNRCKCFGQLATECFIESDCTQNMSDRASKELSTGVILK